MGVVSSLLQSRISHPASVSLNLKSRKFGKWMQEQKLRGIIYKKNVQIHAMCEQTLYSENYLSYLCIHIHYDVERIHKSAIELVKNNLLFFNIFIDMLNNKIQVLINTLVQDKFISNNSKRMSQVAVTH